MIYILDLYTEEKARRNFPVRTAAYAFLTSMVLKQLMVKYSTQ